MSHWSDLRPLASATPSILNPNIGSFLEYPVVAPCHGDPTVLILKNCSFVFQQFLNGEGVWKRQLKVLDLDFGDI